MPTIQEYNAGEVTLHPTDVGVESLQRAGRVIQEESNEAGRAIGGAIARVGDAAGKAWEDHVGRQEVLQQGAEGAALTQQLHQAYNNAAKDPNTLNDPNFANNWVQENAVPAWQKFAASAKTDMGREFANRIAMDGISHISNFAAVDTSTRAADQAVTSLNQQVQTWGNTVAKDPSTVGLAFSQMDATRDAFLKDHPNLTAEASQKIRDALEEQKNKVGESAFMAANLANPKQALADAQAGRFGNINIAGAEKMSFVQQRENQSDARSKAMMDEMQKRDASEAALGKVLGGLTPTPDGKSVTVPPDYRAGLMAALGRGQMQPSQVMEGLRFADAIDAVNQKQVVVRDNPNVTADLIQRVGDNDNPTTRDQVAMALRNQYITPSTAMDLAGKVDPSTAHDIGKLNDNPVVKTQFDAAFQQITGPAGLQLGQASSAARQKFDQFKVDTLRTLQDAMRNHQDVNQYLDPNSKNYLFSADRISQYTPSKQEVATGLVVTNSSAALAAKNQQDRTNNLRDILGKALQFGPKKAPAASGPEDPYENGYH
jgi:hypothetical protein